MKAAEIDIHARELQRRVFRDEDFVLLGLSGRTITSTVTTGPRKTNSAPAASATPTSCTATCASSSGTAVLTRAGGRGRCNFPNLQRFLLGIDFDDFRGTDDLRLVAFIGFRLARH